MIKTVLKHWIYEICIGQLFSAFHRNFAVPAEFSKYGICSDEAIDLIMNDSSLETMYEDLYNAATRWYTYNEVSVDCWASFRNRRRKDWNVRRR